MKTCRTCKLLLSDGDFATTSKGYKLTECRDCYCKRLHDYRQNQIEIINKASNGKWWIKKYILGAINESLSKKNKRKRC